MSGLGVVGEVLAVFAEVLLDDLIDLGVIRRFFEVNSKFPADNLQILDFSQLLKDHAAHVILKLVQFLIPLLI